MPYYILSQNIYGRLLPHLSKDEIRQIIARNRASVGMSINKAEELIRILKSKGNSELEIQMQEETICKYTKRLSEEEVVFFLEEYNNKLKNKDRNIDPLFELTFYYLKHNKRFQSMKKRS